MCPTYLWSVGCGNAKAFPRSLSTKPQRKSCDLGTAWVDVYAIKVLLHDKTWHCSAQIDELGIVHTKRMPRCITFGNGVLRQPGLLVNSKQQIEAVEQEVPR